jgi:phage replication-related protein YjqB (UPF0714/DUF867 family)
MDRYPDYETLRRYEKEGRDYRVRLRRGSSGIVVMAPHGGGIEGGTSEIADAIAGKEHAFYSFDGTKRTGNSALHVTSDHFDEPRGLGLARESVSVVTIHGCEGDEEALYLGGLDFPLAERIREAAVGAGFRVGDGGIRGLGGTGRDNLCNRGTSGRGVQVEMSYGLRRLLFPGLSAIERRRTTPIFQRLAAAIRQGLAERPA